MCVCVYMCRLDLSGMLQERLQSLSSGGTADSEGGQPSCIVSGHGWVGVVTAPSVFEQVALNDVEVSIANIQKLAKEFEVWSSYSWQWSCVM